MKNSTSKSKIIITGGAGFIGSNLVEYFLKKGHYVVCLDNLSTGFVKNIEPFLDNHFFKYIEGDIRDMSTCAKAVQGCEYVLHQAALGSVPRSIEDPVNTNTVNIDGFLNMLIAARDEEVKRFVYAASSSTYGDSKKIPKIEHEIGSPLSPYAITKYVNELYADVFSKTYGIECIGLRYFNVFGKNQSPKGSYAAVIPLWVNLLMNHERPIINGDGSFSRDFTYIDNVIQANEKAMLTSTERILEKQFEYYNFRPGNHTEIEGKDVEKKIGSGTISEVFNVAYGGNTSLIELFNTLRKNLSQYDAAIRHIQPIIGPHREGDIPHSQASILKAKTILNYNPKFGTKTGFKKVCQWYYNNLK